jgi:SAM-dependent methyltransferase
VRAELIGAMRKHLPPSGSRLRLLDMGGQTGPILMQQRADLDVTTTSGAAADWHFAPNSFDAIAACDVALDDDFLAACLCWLRPGGRLIVTLTNAPLSGDWVTRLEVCGYTRILVEPALEDGRGLLLRGEKPHPEARTVDRIRWVAGQEAAGDFETYTGRYVHLLIRQTPHKPAWALKPDDRIEWHAAALIDQGETVLLAFSSLPKAVALMQPAVMQGLIRDVNKVAKFRREAVRAWRLPVILNAPIEMLAGRDVTFFPVDTAAAETPDE